MNWVCLKTVTGLWVVFTWGVLTVLISDWTLEKFILSFMIQMINMWFP